MRLRIYWKKNTTLTQQKILTHFLEENSTNTLKLKSTNFLIHIVSSYYRIFKMSSLMIMSLCETLISQCQTERPFRPNLQRRHPPQTNTEVCGSCRSVLDQQQRTADGKRNRWNSSLRWYVLNLIILEDMKSAFLPPDTHTHAHMHQVP